MIYCKDVHGYRYDGDVSDFPEFHVSTKELAKLFFTRKVLATPELIQMVRREVREMQ